jgi:hypothetical protein
LFGGRGGLGNNRVFGAGLAIPVASGGRSGSKSSKGRDNKKLLHGRPPFDISSYHARDRPDGFAVITKP